MSARSAFPAALLLTAMAAVPARAQEPSPVPEQPVQRQPRRWSVRVASGATAPRHRCAPRALVTTSAAQEVRARVRPAAEAAPGAPAMAEEPQGGRRRSGGGGSGGSTRGGGSVGGGGRSAGGDSGARPRGGVRAPDNGGGGRGASDDGRQAGAAEAVPRGRNSRPSQVVYAPSYGRRYYTGFGGLGYYAYDPWSWYAGYGGPGYSSFGWGGYYGNQWGGYYGNQWGGPYGGGYGAYGGPYGWSIGGVRFKVNPKDAEVYVDGYYAGIVDDFDGVWQQLRLDDGGYHIEVRKPGLDTLTFDVRVQPGRTITYRGEMTATP